MAKSPTRDGKTFTDAIKFMNASGDRTMAEKLDAAERKFAREKKNKEKDKDRLSLSDKTKLINRLRKDNNRPVGGTTPVEDYLNRLWRESSADTIDNQRIRDMNPEIVQASAFMTSSIISPNDLKQGEIAIRVDETSLNTEQQKNLEEYLQQYYEERFKLSVNLPKWIDEALYNSGAKALLVIPMSSIEKEILEKHGVSNESTNKINTALEKMGSLFGVTSKTDISLENLSSKTISVATESLSQYATTVDGIEASKPKRREFNKVWSNFIKDVTSQEAISLIDNPFILRSYHLSNSIANEALVGKLGRLTAIEGRNSRKTITSTVQDKLYRKQLMKGHNKDKRTHLNGGQNSKDADDVNEPKPFVQLVNTPNEESGEPLFMEIPTESVIPISVPGSISSVIAYICIVDEHGHFASIASDMNKGHGPGRIDNYDRYNFNQIYQAAGFNAHTGGQRSNEAQSVMAKLYQSIIEGYLDEKVRGAGYRSFSLGSNPAVYKYMFNQYLCNRQTRLIFIPANMLTYLAYNHGPDGRGVSDLEKIKYVLSLKSNLEVSKTISQLNAAVDRKKITFTVEGEANGGALLQQYDTIRDEYIKKNSWSLASDPRVTTNEILNKGISINAKGLPGLNYDIEDVTNEKQAATIDEALQQDLKDRLFHGLMVPNSVMNATGEDEYAKSVATQNLFVANNIQLRQNITTAHISEFLQNYTRNSPSIRRTILEIISDVEDTRADKTEQGNIDPNKLTPDDKERLNNIIESITISLPPPTIAPNKALYEVINDASQAAETIVNILYPEENYGGNSSLVEANNARKAIIKSKYVHEFMGVSGINISNVFDPDNFTITDIIDERQMMSNFAKALIRQKKSMNIDNDNQDSQESGGDTFGGGFGGGDSFGGGGGFGGSDTGGGFDSDTGGSDLGGGF